MATSQDFVNWVCSDAIDYRFLKAILVAEGDSLLRFASGTTHQTIYFPEVKAFHVCLPSKKEQARIAGSLSALEDKIELNRRMNETLEAIAQAIFKSWFVDFDPVRAMMDDRRPSGMDPATAALFPDSLCDSALGPIPQGWRVSRLEEIISLSREKLDPSDFRDEVFLHFSIPAFDDGMMPRSELGGSIRSTKFVVQPEAVLLSRLNPRIPRVWLNFESRITRAVCSTEFAVAMPREGWGREYVYSLLSSRSFLSTLETLVTGTSGSHQRVKPESLLGMKVLIPDLCIARRYSELCGPVLRGIALNRTQSETLESVRDTLLPRLISGKMRIRDAEKLVEEAV